MNAESILGVVVQYGLPTVLLFGFAWWHKRQQDAWEAERKELYKAWNDAVLARVEDAREYGSTLTESQQATARATEAVTRLTDEWARWQDNDRARELRAEVRQLRDTGSHQALPEERLQERGALPPKLPRGR